MKLKIPILILVVSLLFVIQCQQEQETFEAFKLFSYEKDQKIIGSRIGSLNMLTIHYLSQESMSRKLALMRFQDISGESLMKLMKQKPGGVLIILPNAQLNEINHTSNWQTIMNFFGNKNMIIPVQFVFENQYISQHYQFLQNQLKNNGQEKGDQFRLIITADQSKPILGSHFIQDYFAILDESNYQRKKSSILILVSLDKFMPSQEFVDQQDSSLSIFFSVMNQMQKVYQQYNLIGQSVNFYVTSSASLDYTGLLEWLENSDNSQFTSSLSTIIQLENLGSSENIFVEQFGPVNSEDQIQKNLSEQLINSGLKVESSNYAQTESQLAQNFRKKNLVLIRVSDRTYKDVNYLPISQLPNADIQKNLVTGIVKGIATNIYQNTEGELMDLCNFSNEQKIEELNQIFNTQNRFLNYLLDEQGLNQEVKRMFKKFRPAYTKYAYQVKNVRFYTSSIGVAQLIKYQDPFLNVYIFVASLVYLFVLYLLFKHTPLIIKKIKVE